MQLKGLSGIMSISNASVSGLVYTVAAERAKQTHAPTLSRDVTWHLCIPGAQ